MTSVHVKASSEYDVIVGRGLLDQTGERTAALLSPRKAAVVSDDRVWPLYGEQTVSSLRRAGIEPVSFVFPAGEASKNLETWSRLIMFLAEEKLSRTDAVIALGGGVVGDLAGFAAASYLRGVPCVQIPTTLLAAVDSSVGGKTAVDLPQGKNLAGAFHQPAMVLCDPGTLSTLPEDVFLDGCAEVIKYGVLGDGAFFSELEQVPVREQLLHVITVCVGMKRDLVCRDEFDTGARRLLNLGHTFGHAAEQHSGYTLSHGRAVSVGMAMIARAAAKRGICTPETAGRIEGILVKYGLPVSCDAPAETLLDAVLRDKKIADGDLKFVVPEEIGRCRILPVPPGEILGWIRDGGER